MERFWRLLEESVIVQGVITVMVLGSVCYLAVTGQVIPDYLRMLVSLITGFYFGAKLQIARRTAKSK